MDQPGEVLVISSELGNRRALLEVLNREHWGTICTSTVSESQELLATRDLRLVFCEGQLSDGTHRDVLKTMRSLNANIPLVVTSRVADWDEYLGVLQQGAFDLIESPCKPTDVTWVIRRAQCENKKRPAPIDLGKAHDDMFSQEVIRPEDEIRIDEWSVDSERGRKASSA